MTPGPISQGDPALNPSILNPEKKATQIGLFFPWTEQEYSQKEMEIVNYIFQKTILYE